MERSRDEMLYAVQKERISSSIIRFLKPNDLGAVIEVNKSAWPTGAPPEEAPHTWSAEMEDSHLSAGIFDSNGKLMGYTFNFLKFDGNETSLWIHMMGVSAEFQGLGVGGRLMEFNFNLINKSKLGETVSKMSLTSDPLADKNMYFYLHKLGMYSHNYALGTYSEEKRSIEIPSDRLLFFKHPKATGERKYPNTETYGTIRINHPELFLEFDQTPSDKQNFKNNMFFVEVPTNINHVDNLGINDGVMWREFHRNTLPSLFQKGYTAVDLTRSEISGKIQNFMVFIRNFDEKDSETISKTFNTLV